MFTSFFTFHSLNVVSLIKGKKMHKTQRQKTPQIKNTKRSHCSLNFLISFKFSNHRIQSFLSKHFRELLFTFQTDIPFMFSWKIFLSRDLLNHLLYVSQLSSILFLEHTYHSENGHFILSAWKPWRSLWDVLRTFKFSLGYGCNLDSKPKEEFTLSN